MIYTQSRVIYTLHVSSDPR